MTATEETRVMDTLAGPVLAYTETEPTGTVDKPVPPSSEWTWEAVTAVAMMVVALCILIAGYILTMNELLSWP
jgi:hypothetical protein